MSSDTKTPVSTVAGVGRGLRLGDYGGVRESIVDQGRPIEPEEIPNISNSDILDMGVTGGRKEVAVKGFLHDLTVDLIGRVPDILEFEDEITADRCKDILEGAVEGTGRRSPEVEGSLANLEKKYGLEPHEVMEYSTTELDFQDALDQISEYAEEYFGEAEKFGRISTEEGIFGKGMAGRMDAVWRDEDDRIVEVKAGSPSTYDRLQATAYWLMHGDDPEVVLEYPLEDERHVYKPGSDGSEGVTGFDPREEVPHIGRYREKTETYITRLKELQEKYFESMDREKATRKALRELEIDI